MEAPDFFVEDLLDLSNGGDDVMADAFFAGNSTDSSTVVTPVDSCNSSVSGTDFPTRPSFPDSHFAAGDLCVPYDDMAELEWLSNFVEESFSSEDLRKFQLLPMGGSGQPGPAQFHSPSPPQPPSSSVPGKARSKRSRVAPGDWSTRLLMVSASSSPATSSSDPNPNPNPNPNPKKTLKRRENNTGSENNPNGEVRRCLHCAAEKTPQWRTGPMGPKTLCNACGVRYKSGRLVPEYRPAASPTFVSTKHSNSHRKVVELRRQKEVVDQHQHHHHHHHHHQQDHQFVGHYHQNVLMGVPRNNGGGEDYLIHHHLGPDYRQMI